MKASCTLKEKSNGRTCRVRVGRRLLTPALCLILAPSHGSAEEKPPFPAELSKIRAEYVRDLEPLEDEQREDLRKLKRSYDEALDKLGRDFLSEENPLGAVAVKIEKAQLRDGKGYYPEAVEGGERLGDLRESYLIALEKLERSYREKFRVLANRYIQKLERWAELYEERRPPDEDSALAVRAEIASVEKAVLGFQREPEEVVAVEQPPPVGQTEAEPGDQAGTDSATEGGVTDPGDGLALAEGWEQPAQSNEVVAREIVRLLGRFGQPRPHLERYDGLTLNGAVTYLMPLQEACAEMKLDLRTAQEAPLRVPGFPRNSLRLIRFGGIIADGIDPNSQMVFDEVLLIIDQREQVVAIQLSQSRFEQDWYLQYRPLPKGWEVYDLATGQIKADPAFDIWHKIYAEIDGELIETSENETYPNSPRFRVETVYFGTDLKVNRAVRLYLARPFVDVMLYCCREVSLR